MRRINGVQSLVLLTLVSLIGLFGVSGCKDKKSSGEVDMISGAGASLPLPYYQMAFKAFQDTMGISVNYGAVGSGSGITSLRDKVVDFGASDAFLSEEEMQGFSGPVIHIPTCMSAVVMAYNLEGVEKLNLNADIITGIYLGEITKWNDPKIVAVNPDVTLPDMDITPVYRSDGSGTTKVFSHYMSSVNAQWREVLSEGKALQWKAGVAAKGNPGVAGIISSTPGAVGYIGSEYAFSMQIPYASVLNAAGNYVLPNVTTIAEAGNQEIPADTRTMITNAPGETAYPICCFTWVLIYQEQAYDDSRTLAEAQATVNLMNFMLSDKAQNLTETVHYVRLPNNVRQAAQALINSVTFNGQPVVQ